MRRAFLFAALLFWSAAVAAQSVYFGSLHFHTSYSDGWGMPDQAYRQACAWQLRDASGNVWLLVGSLAAGQQAMSLNNDGDVVELVDPAGTVVDTVRYGRASEGVLVPLQRP